MLLPQDNIFYQSDLINLQFQLFKNKSTNEYWDLTDYKIRFELSNKQVIPVEIRKSSANVPGGSNEQISFVNAIQGIFIVTLLSSDTVNLFPADYPFQIQIEDGNNNKITVFDDSIRIITALINWD